MLVQVLANADGNLLCACLPEACCPVRALLFGTLEGALATFSQNLHEFSPKKSWGRWFGSNELSFSIFR